MSSKPEGIFHIALPDDWRAARQDGKYKVSTNGKTLDEVGFIHCSHANQLVKVANFAYPDVTEVIVLEIDPEMLDAEVKQEPAAENSNETFPHIYGPVPTMAVINEEWWERGGDGVWHRPPFL